MNQKFKIMKPAPELSDVEIRSYMDFDALIRKQKSLEFRKSILRWSAGVTLLALLVASSLIFYNYYFRMENASKNRSNNANGNNLPLSDSLSAELPTKNEEHHADSTAMLHEAETKAIKKGAPIEAVKPPPSQTTKPESTKENTDVYIQAEPVEGYKNLYDYLNQNLKYPPEAIADSLQGGVVVSFIVNADGKVDHITVERDISDSFSREVIDLIEKMPAWKPATLNGKPVRSKITLPLTFQILHVKP
jgi:TonB family protein